MITDIDTIEVTLNDSQALIAMVNANTTYCLWPRAGGKTSGGIGPRILHLSEVMPRSQILIVSDTYDRLTTRIIPNIINFFESKLGLVENIDFVKYKKPPDYWPKPLIPLDKFERVIMLASGTALCLVSTRVEGSANAYNAQAALFDETKFLKEEDIDTEILPALRGGEKEFGHLPEWLSKWFFTDKYGPNIKWLLAKKKLVNQRAVEVVLQLQYQIIELQKQCDDKDTPKSKVYYLDRKMNELITIANRIRKNMIYVSDMKPYENMDVVGEFYFKSQKRICKTLEYEVAVLNKDPDKVENTFYPTLTIANKYHSDRLDYDPTLPLIGAFDYNWRLCPMPVVQINELPGSLYRTINFIDYVYTEHPEGLVDAVNKFCERFSDHETKMFVFIYDQTAIGKNPLKTTFYQTVIDAFTEHGWTVVEEFIGEQPDHDVKYEAIKNWLFNMGDYAIMINQTTCEALIKSIEQAPAVIKGGKTAKDKRTETDPNFPALDSTHGSDAFDMILWGLFEYDIRYTVGTSPGTDMKTN